MFLMDKLTLSSEDFFINAEGKKRRVASITVVNCVRSLLKSVLTLKQRNVVMKIIFDFRYATISLSHVF